jgi:hypothetical protein
VLLGPSPKADKSLEPQAEARQPVPDFGLGIAPQSE